jgi:hypothetical protein
MLPQLQDLMFLLSFSNARLRFLTATPAAYVVAAPPMVPPDPCILKLAERLEMGDTIIVPDKIFHLHYRGIVGSLGYLVKRTRPDLAFAYSGLSKYVQCPQPHHMLAAQHVLRYLRDDIPDTYILKRPFYGIPISASTFFWLCLNPKGLALFAPWCDPSDNDKEASDDEAFYGRPLRMRFQYKIKNKGEQFEKCKVRLVVQGDATWP